MALGITLSLPADAVTQARRIRAQAGQACQLSIPTTDTKVRPKATGFRNEGTTNAFVICGFPTPDGDLTAFVLNFQPLDTVDHPISCTGVNGSAFSNPVYVTKNASTGANPSGGSSLTWDASDFGGTAGSNLPGSGYFSVTCVLPGQATIPSGYADYNEDVGA
ncbi:hypothetical protein GCM10025793_00200 [Lysobacter lycopersici]